MLRHDKHEYWHSVDVAEFRRAEFQVDTTTDKPVYVRGEQAKLAIDAQYLFGAPMRGAQVRYRVSQAPGELRPKGC